MMEGLTKIFFKGMIIKKIWASGLEPCERKELVEDQKRITAIRNKNCIELFV